MKKIRISFLLFLFTLFLTTSLFAQEGSEEVTTTDKGIIFSDDTGEGVITGKVISLDLGSGTIAVKTEGDTERTFSVVAEETILWKGIDDIELSNIEEGQEAEVGYYTDEDGKLIASWVDVLIEGAI